MLWLYGTGQEIPAYAQVTVEVDCGFYGISKKNHVFIAPSFPRRRESPKMSDEFYDINVLNNHSMLWLYGTGQEISACAQVTVEVDCGFYGISKKKPCLQYKLCHN